MFDVNGPFGVHGPQMDATAMGFEPNSFDVAIDKGTLDAIMSAPTTGGVSTAYKMFGELLRWV